MWGKYKNSWTKINSIIKCNSFFGYSNCIYNCIKYQASVWSTPTYALNFDYRNATLDLIKYGNNNFDHKIDHHIIKQKNSRYSALVTEEWKYVDKTYLSTHYGFRFENTISKSSWIEFHLSGKNLGKLNDFRQYGKDVIETAQQIRNAINNLKSFVLINNNIFNLDVGKLNELYNFNVHDVLW